MQLPFQRVSQATQVSAAREVRLATLYAQQADGTYDLGTLTHQGPWETLFLTIEVLANSETSVAECIVPPLVGAAVDRNRMCPRLRHWAGPGTQGSAQHPPPPHPKPFITSEEEMGSDTVKNQVPKLVLL